MIIKLVKILFFIIALITLSCTFKDKNIKDRLKIDGYYLIDNIKDTTELAKGFGIVRGTVFDSYTKIEVSYGYVIVSNKDKQGINLDSLGKFELKLRKGEYVFNISSIGNTPLFTDTILINENTITLLKIYLGKDIIY